MSRRFLYMVVGNCSYTPSSYTLHRINPSRLFYPNDSPERAAAAVAAGARATTMEAAQAAERASTTPMEAAEDFRARRRRLRAAMRNRATTKRTKAEDVEKARLPVPRMNFSSPGIVMDFALIGRSKDKIVVDGANPGYTRNNWNAPGRADDASHSVRAQLSCIEGLPERETVPVAVGDNLYFMDEEVEVVPSKEKNMLRALIRYPGREPDPDDSDRDWYWYSFMPPPYGVIVTGENDPRPRYPERRHMLGAYAVVSGSHIWASTRIRGTYSMDTVSGTWSKASDLPLPFRGLAEYAPEHGLWFGFPNDECESRDWDSGLLCAWDLNSDKAADAPVVETRGVWEGFGAPRESFNVRSHDSHLVHLGDGGGRFCVTKLYQMNQPLPAGACPRCYNDGVPTQVSFAVLTGVEVERCGYGGELRMIKHRSRKYSFGEYNFPHVVL